LIFKLLKAYVDFSFTFCVTCENYYFLDNSMCHQVLKLRGWLNGGMVLGSYHPNLYWIPKMSKCIPAPKTHHLDIVGKKFTLKYPIFTYRIIKDGKRKKKLPNNFPRNMKIRNPFCVPNMWFIHSDGFLIFVTYWKYQPAKGTKNEFT
jgi:hypothetical protein